MRIIQIMPQFDLAGAEVMCEALSSELKILGEDVIIVSLYDFQSAITDRLEAAGIRIIYLNKKPGLDISMIFKLVEVFRAEKADVIHTHRYVMQYAIPAAVVSGIKRRVHTVHNIAQEEQTEIGKIVNKAFYKCCNVIPVALSEKIKKTIQEVYNIPEKDIPVVFNGIDLSKCNVKNSYAPKERFTIVHIGRFADVKNHELLLRTFAIFKAKHPEARLQLIGDGKLRENMVQLAQELGLSDSVEFAGAQNNVYPLLHEGDVFILPSKFEGMPVSLIEAMGTGLPIIASKVGGVPDMLTDNENALLIEPKMEELLNALEVLYADPMLRKQLGQGALKRSRDFSARAMAAGYEKIYRII